MKINLLITLLMLGWFSYEMFFGSELRPLVTSGILLLMNFMIVLKKELDDLLENPR